MSEFGSAESFAPGEDGGGVSEQLSEEAKERFAASAAAAKQIRKQEKKSKKRDKKVAAVIKKFFDDDQYKQMAVLISRLSARNCPSIFILAIVSLIDEDSLNVVQEYLDEITDASLKQTVDETMALTKNDQIDSSSNKQLVNWIIRMQIVLSLDPERTLLRLMLDEKNIDGTVLQLTMFVLQRFFVGQEKSLPFDKVQPLTASILQAVFEPFMNQVRMRILEQKAASRPRDEDDEDDED